MKKKYIVDKVLKLQQKLGYSRKELNQFDKNTLQGIINELELEINYMDQWKC